MSGAARGNMSGVRAGAMRGAGPVWSRSWRSEWLTPAASGPATQPGDRGQRGQRTLCDAWRGRPHVIITHITEAEAARRNNMTESLWVQNYFISTSSSPSFNSHFYEKLLLQKNVGKIASVQRFIKYMNLIWIWNNFREMMVSLPGISESALGKDSCYPFPMCTTCSVLPLYMYYGYYQCSFNCRWLNNCLNEDF